MASNAKRVVVIGGGLAGVSYMHYLRNFLIALDKQSAVERMILLESNDYIGGSLKTKHYEDGVLHELGPRSVRSFGMRSKNTLALLEHIGLKDSIVPISKSGGSRYLYTAENEFYELDLTFKGLLRRYPASNNRIIKSVLKEIFTKRMDLTQVPHGDPSIYDFIEHRFGPDAAREVADPLLRGITAGDARKLSTKCLFDEFLYREQARDSIIVGTLRAPPPQLPDVDEFFFEDVKRSKLVRENREKPIASMNLEQGLQSLPQRLTNILLNTNDDGKVSIYSNSRATSIEFDRSNESCTSKIGVTTPDGQTNIEADHVVCALPSVHLSKLLPEASCDASAKLANALAQIEHVPVACVCVEYRHLYVPNSGLLKSFGFLTNSKSSSKVLGVSFDSNNFPKHDQDGSFRMTVMVGGAWWREIFDTNDLDSIKDSDIEQIALSEINKILGLAKEPHRVTTYLWKTGIAQYHVGHKGRVADIRNIIEEMHAPLTLIGQSYDGITVNDVIYFARSAAYKFVKSL